MALLTWALVLIVAGLFLYWHIQQRYSYFIRKNIPHLKPTFPFGNLAGITTEFHLADWLREKYLLFRGRDKLFGYYFGTAAFMMITDMDTAHDILVRDLKFFPNAHGEVWSDPLTRNLFTMEGEQWRTIRTKLSPVFSAFSIPSVMTVLRGVGTDLEAFVDRSASSGMPINIRDLFMRYISDAVSSSVLGLDIAALRDEHHPLMSIGERMFNAKGKKDMLFFTMVISYSAVLKKLPIRVFPRDISDYFSKTIGDAMTARAESGEVKNDLLDLLVRIEREGCLTEDETGEVLGKITHEQLLGHAFMTFFLGFLPSRVALHYGMYELAKNPDIQARLRDDILERIPRGEEITYDAIQSIPYLQQVVDETLRKYAPVPWIQRKCKSDYRVRNSNHIIERGTRILIPLIGFHNDHRDYTDPDRFNPNRMTAEKMKKRHPCSFIPFGIGPRACMANRLAYLYVKYGITLLLRQYKFTVHERTVEPIVFAPWAMDMVPTTGLWLKAEKISADNNEVP